MDLDFFFLSHPFYCGFVALFGIIALLHDLILAKFGHTTATALVVACAAVMSLPLLFMLIIKTQVAAAVFSRTLGVATQKIPPHQDCGKFHTHVFT